MARKDFYHDNVKRALVKDGWRITHEPLKLPFLNSKLKIDIGAERFEVNKGNVKMKIAVEIKNFRERKDYANEFEKAVGQVTTYKRLLRRFEPDRDTFLAISVEAYEKVFSDPDIRDIVTDSNIKLVVFDPASDTIKKWNAEKWNT